MPPLDSENPQYMGRHNRAQVEIRGCLVPENAQKVIVDILIVIDAIIALITVKRSGRLLTTEIESFFAVVVLGGLVHDGILIVVVVIAVMLVLAAEAAVVGIARGRRCCAATAAATTALAAHVGVTMNSNLCSVFLVLDAVPALFAVGLCLRTSLGVTLCISIVLVIIVIRLRIPRPVTVPITIEAAGTTYRP
jgi:hypothetical protein